MAPRILMLVLLMELCVEGSGAHLLEGLLKLLSVGGSGARLLEGQKALRALTVRAQRRRLLAGEISLVAATAVGVVAAAGFRRPSSNHPRAFTTGTRLVTSFCACLGGST